MDTTSVPEWDRHGRADPDAQRGSPSALTRTQQSLAQHDRQAGGSGSNSAGDQRRESTLTVVKQTQAHQDAAVVSAVRLIQQVPQQQRRSLAGQSHGRQTRQLRQHSATPVAANGSASSAYAGHIPAGWFPPPKIEALLKEFLPPLTWAASTNMTSYLLAQQKVRMRNVLSVHDSQLYAPDRDEIYYEHQCWM